MSTAHCVLVTLAMSAVCIAGDYYLKLASQTARPFLSLNFLLGTIIFSLTSVGWVVVLPSMKLATVGVTYGVSTILFMTMLGCFVFGETLTWVEWLGISLGVASIFLLCRFA